MVTLPDPMAFDGSTPCWIPDVPVAREDTWRMKIAKFGDGYQMRVLDGINALDMSWTLQWTNRPADIINAMVSFLTSNKAKAFMFKDQQTGITYRVFCDKWQINWSLRRPGGKYIGTLSAQFDKANGMAP